MAHESFQEYTNRILRELDHAWKLLQDERRKHAETLAESQRYHELKSEAHKAEVDKLNAEIKRLRSDHLGWHERLVAKVVCDTFETSAKIWASEAFGNFNTSEKLYRTNFLRTRRHGALTHIEQWHWVGVYVSPNENQTAVLRRGESVPGGRWIELPSV